MRVLQVHAGYRFAAGEDTVVANEAAALRSAGHDVEQFIVANPASATAAMGALARSTHNRSIARRVTALIDDLGPDVVHVHNTWFAVSPAAIDAAADRAVPVVMTLHNYRLGCLGTDLFRDGEVCTACVGRSPWAGVVHGCYRDSRALSALQAVEVMVTRKRKTLTDRVTRFISPSEFMAACLVDIGVPADRLVVKPHFTNDPGPASGRSIEVARSVVRRAARSGQGRRNALEILVVLPPAANADSLELVVIGDGPLSATLQQSAPRSVRFVGWQSRADVLERLLAARALVFPSEWYEPFGMVLIEALSAGLPIVTSNASGAAAIAGGPDELVFPTRDVSALATALGLLGDDRFVDRTGAGSRRRYEHHFSENVGIDALEAVYDAAIRAVTA